MKKTKGTPRKKGSIIERVLHLAFELSQNKWKLGFSDGNKMRFKSIVARSLEQLHEEIEKAQVRFKMKGDVRIVSCYEAGRDGFWLHRRMWWWTHPVLK
jgi:transposase